MAEEIYNYFSLQEKIAYHIRADGYEPKHGMANLVDTIIVMYYTELYVRGWEYFKYKSSDPNCADAKDVLEFISMSDGYECYDIA